MKRMIERVVVALGLLVFLASSVEAQQLANPGFEDGVLEPWVTFKDGAKVLNHDAHAGSFCAELGPHGTVLQKVQGLTSGAAYTLSVYVKIEGGAKAVLAVQNYGGNFIQKKLTDAANYEQLTLNFTMGVGDSGAEILLNNFGSSGTVNADDFSIDLAPAAPVALTTNAAPGSATAPAPATP